MSEDSTNMPAPTPGGDRAPARTRRLTPGQADEILRIASSRELGRDLPSRHDSTLEDLMAAAADVGLDPAAVRRAASILPEPKGGLASVVLGAPDHRRIHAYLEGATIPRRRGELERTSEAMLGRAGSVIQSDPTQFVWRESHGLGRTTVEVTRAGNGTEIHVDADRAGHYVAGWFAGLAGWGVLSAVTPLGALGPLGGVLGFLAVPILLARPFWTRADRRLRERLEHLTLELARVVEEAPRPALRRPEGHDALPEPEVPDDT